MINYKVYITWYIISFNSSLRRRINNSVIRQLFVSSYPPIRLMRKYVFARGSLKVSSSLNQNFINGSSSMHLGKETLDGSFDKISERTEKSLGMNSFFKGKCKHSSMTGGSLQISSRDGETSSSIYDEPNQGSRWNAET